MPPDGKTKKCFVIGPIGEERSDERNKADWLLEGIIRPVAERDPFNYEVQRADQFAVPGLITDQVITSVIDADLVIADLTRQNPNAFYELAIRHMEQKPVIHMAEADQQLPFDIKDYRAIFYRLVHPTDLDAAKFELARQVEAIEKPGYEPNNPVTKARGFKKLRESADSKDRLIADSLGALREIEQRLTRLELLQTGIGPLPTSVTSTIPVQSQGIEDLAEFTRVLQSRTAKRKGLAETLIEILSEADKKRSRATKAEEEDGS